MFSSLNILLHLLSCLQSHMHCASVSENRLHLKSSTDMHVARKRDSQSSLAYVHIDGCRSDLLSSDAGHKEENEESDESDSEIFRVKRRSSVKVESRIVRDSPSISIDHQVCSFLML